MPDDSQNQVPEDEVHIIVSGDTLGGIARRHHIDLKELLAANPQIEDPDVVFKGQRIRIPHAISPHPVLTAPVVPAVAHATPATPAPDAPGKSDGVAPGMPNTSGMSDAAKYDLYAPYFSRYGVNVAALESGKRVLLGLRITSSTKANSGLGVYDDRIVIAWRDDGGKHVIEFKGTTEPSGRYEGKEGLDANFDGRRDLGCLPDGLYEYQRSHSDHLGDVLAPTSDVFVIRDVNHDGKFTDVDKMAVTVREKLNSGRSVLFHMGGNKMTGSAGCQTMPPGEFRSFWKQLGHQSRYQYALATVA
jgi:LysM repeat protein